MKDLFDPTLADHIKRRIMCLHPESERQWGNMTLAQTLAHCTSGIQMATGVINPRRASFPANVIGLVIKPLVFGDDKPMRRNSPSSPELFPTYPAQCNFEREQTDLIATIDNFVTQGSACCSQHPHPFFGALEPQQWAILMYKHVDHHLRQFGV
ncbi:MAG: DUF1569 domain-containing protein [Edaphobacter sp.]